MEDKFFDGLREKVDNLEKETDKDRMKDLIVDIIVNLEKLMLARDVKEK